MRDKKRAKVQITRRALVQRINRKLAKEGRAGQQLKAYRGGRWETDIGRYYVVDLDRNAVEAAHVDLETIGRELGVIAGYEALEEE